MLWYYKNKQCFEYPSQELITNPLTERFHKSVYEKSDEMELYYSLGYMKENAINNLSVIFPIEDLSVNYGNSRDFDIKFCDSQQIPYRYENRSGGCMVLFPGNIITYSVYTSNNFLRQHKFLKDMVSWLKEKDITAATDNNDLMINGKKIVGTVSETLPDPYRGWIYFATQISVNIDAKLINQICLKPTLKVPGALSDYGITTEEVMEWTRDWFDKHRNWEG